MKERIYIDYGRGHPGGRRVISYLYDSDTGETEGLLEYCGYFESGLTMVLYPADAETKKKSTKIVISVYLVRSREWWEKRREESLKRYHEENQRRLFEFNNKKGERI